MSFKKTTVKKIEKIDKELSLLFKTIIGLYCKTTNEFEEIQKANKKLVSELGKRDRALLEFLKVKIEEVKTVKTDENGKDVIVYSYKLTKK